MRETDRRLPRERHGDRGVLGVPARSQRVRPGGALESEARRARRRRESRCEDANAPDADPPRSRSGTRGESHPSGDGRARRKTPDGAEGIDACATVGSLSRPVIKPDPGEIEVQRLWPVSGRTRPDHALGPATVARTSAVARVVSAARTAQTPLSGPVTEGWRRQASVPRTRSDSVVSARMGRTASAGFPLRPWRHRTPARQRPPPLPSRASVGGGVVLMTSSAWFPGRARRAAPRRVR